MLQITIHVPRCIYGTYWKSPKNRLFPEHQTTTGKQPASRPATMTQSNYLTSFYERKFPIGGTLNIKLINGLLSEENKNGCDLVVKHSQIDCSNETRKDLSSTLNLSPIGGIKRKNVEYLADSSLR